MPHFHPLTSALFPLPNGYLSMLVVVVVVVVVIVMASMGLFRLSRIFTQGLLLRLRRLGYFVALVSGLDIPRVRQSCHYYLRKP
jgi:hypothetical protein